MRYNPALDGIRAAAALMVVAFHARAPGFGGGFLGVDVFFVLSGYLITRILTAEVGRTGNIDIRGFLVRRFRRLYPALLVLLLAYLLLAPSLFPELDSPAHYRDALLSALYLSDYARPAGQPMPVLNHTWSLSVEMQFYLLFPFLLLWLLRMGCGTALSVLTGGWAVLTFWRWTCAVDPGIGWDVYYYRPDTHATGLLLGAAVALVGPAGGRLLPVLGIAVLALAVKDAAWGRADVAVHGFTMAEIGTALVVAAPPLWLGHALLAWLGRMSYGLYLWHYPMIRVARDQGLAWEPTLAVGLLGGLAAAAASYHLVETRFRPRPAAGAGIDARHPGRPVTSPAGSPGPGR